MFVCFNCGDGFKTYDCFLKHSCDAEASSFEINFKKEEENISDQVKIQPRSANLAYLVLFGFWVLEALKFDLNVKVG